MQHENPDTQEDYLRPRKTSLVAANVLGLCYLVALTLVVVCLVL